MQAEFWLFAGLFAATLLLLRRQCRSVSAAIWVGGGVLLVIGTAFGFQRRQQKTEASRREVRAKLPHAEANEYVSSVNCRSCHPDQYASWHRSFHRTMTQLPSPQTVRGKFDNLVLNYDGDDHRVERRGNQFWVELVDPDWKLVYALKMRDFENGILKSPPIRPEHKPKLWRQIDMLTGSHHMQACWVAGEFGNQQFIFPFIYLFEDQRWVPREEAFLKPPDAEKMVQVWNGSCIRCHATAGKPLQDPRTSVFQTEVAELGIACEACHGPAYQHVRYNRDPRRRYVLHSSGNGDPTIVNPKRLDSKRSSEVCGHCHGVKYIRDQADWMAHGFRFRPGGKLDDDAPIMMRLAKIPEDPRFPEPVRKNPELLHGTFWPDGMIRVSGREYNGLLETPCFQRGEMSCLSCHSMHQSDPDDQLAAGKDGNQACLQCHDKFRDSPSPLKQRAVGLFPTRDTVLPLARGEGRGEGEQSALLRSETNRAAAASPSPLKQRAAELVPTRDTVLPLPKGEGRGEGEQSALIRPEMNPAAPTPLTAHTHHAANSSGSLCYNCHMPHTTYGLLKSIRSHEISSPNVTTTLKTGRPNACNLCHLDKSLGWAATHLNEWYRTPKPNLGEEEQNTSAAVHWVLRGDAGQRAILAWHMGWKPALETSGTDWIPFYLTQLLTDPYSAVRYVAKRSLKRFPGFEKLDYDYLGPEEQRRAVQQNCLALAKPPMRPNPSLLQNSDGTWHTNKISSLITRRDDHPIELLE